MVKACWAATCVECMSIVNERHESKACQMHVSNKVKETYLRSSSDDKIKRSRYQEIYKIRSSKVQVFKVKVKVKRVS